MITLMGITGQVGGAIARTLLQQGKPIRGVVRDRTKAQAWADRGVELVVADSTDAAALTAAFRGSERVFVMVPPAFAPPPNFPEARAVSTAVAQALTATRPARVVALSSIGAHRPSGLGLITQLYLFEEALRPLGLATTFLRPGWFMENAVWDIAPAMATGTIASFLTPLDRPIPVIATDDVGRVAAELLQETGSGRDVVELTGPHPRSPNDLAGALAHALGRSVTATAVPREIWESQFRAQGSAYPAPRIEMLDGFNSQWIVFEQGLAHVVKGRIDLDVAIESLVKKARASAS